MTISEGYTTGLYTGYMLSFLTIFVYKFIYSSWMHQKFFISCGDHKLMLIVIVKRNILQREINLDQKY